MSIARFSDLQLSPAVMQAVEALGFSIPTPVQAQTIPPLLAGLDLVGQSQTGSGKTAAFCIPGIERIEPGGGLPQMLVLCPTRELAVQVAEEARRLAQFKPGVQVAAVYGGQSYTPQIAAMRKAAILIGTPGRLLDHLRKGTLKLGSVKMLVLDEADRMLDMGFAEDIETVLEQIPEEAQRVFFSATMPPVIRKMIDRNAKQPHSVRIDPGQVAVSTVEQVCFEVRPKSMIEALARLIAFHEIGLGLIFTNTKIEADRVADELSARGFSADRLHGDLSQVQRDRVMNAFRKGHLNLLVATDIAARGIDVNNVEAVFNLDLPRDLDDYIHRIGRTARAGKSGLAFSLVTPRGAGRIRQIEKRTGQPVVRRHLPTLDAIEARRQTLLTDAIRKRVEAGALTEAACKTAQELLQTGCPPADLLAALFEELRPKGKNRDVGQRIYEDDSDTQIHEHKPTRQNNRGTGRTRLFMSGGSQMKITPGDIVGALCNETGIPAEAIGEIDIYPKHLFVEVNDDIADQVREAMQHTRVKGRLLNVKPAQNHNAHNSHFARKRRSPAPPGGPKPHRKKPAKK